MYDKKFSQPRLMSSQAHFSRVPQADIPRSMFDRSHQYKSTFNAGYLVPIFVDEVLPGDTFKLKMTSFARLATPLTPFMDNVYADVFFFFVPNRLVWENWERFNGAQDNPGDSTDYTVPTVAPAVGGILEGSIWDYFGIPTTDAGYGPHVCAFPFRAYNLIYNSWFRDQNIQDAVYINTGDGIDAATHYAVLRRGKRHDYFTSCLPWPQKGPAVSIPFGDVAPVAPFFIGTPPDGDWATAADTGSMKMRAYEDATHSSLGLLAANSTASTTGVNFVHQGGDATHIGADIRFPYLSEWGDTTGRQYLATDLTGALDVTINALRESFQLQRLLERDARGGTRYVEILKSHFGVTSPDFRLQRPEYLGGGTTMLNTTPIPQTSATGVGDTPQANLAAMGTFSHLGIGFNKSFVEHGTIIGLISVRADMTYQNCLNRMWSRETRFDFYWPALSHLGEQAVLRQEIYYDGVGGSGNDNVFGYQERYAEYRYKPSLITGKFRSQATDSLDVWHLAQDFASPPELDKNFIVENPPIDRVIAVVNEPHFLLDVLYDLKCARPMPVYSVPGLIDHF